MKYFFLLTLVLGLTSACKRPQVSWLSELSDSLNGPQKPVSEKPKPGDEDYVRTIWMYQETRAVDADMKDTSLCSPSFVLDDECPLVNTRCHRGNSVYACIPEGFIIFYKGKVVDPSGKGISNVYVQVGMVGMTDIAHAYSRDDGSFIIRSSRSCYPVAWAHKEGYMSTVNDYEYASTLTNCSYENWGSKDIKLELVLKK